MGKFLPDISLDGGLIEDEKADAIHICRNQPADYNAATTPIQSGGEQIATKGLAPAELVIGPGDASNSRKLTVTPAAALSIVATGVNTGSHVVLTTAAGTVLRMITTMTPLALDYGSGSNTVTVSPYKREAQQAT